MLQLIKSLSLNLFFSAYTYTAMLICPKRPSPFTISVGNIYDYACPLLDAPFSTAASPAETRLIESLVECCKEHPEPARFPQVLKILARVSLRWKESKLLAKILRICEADKDIDILGVETFVQVYSAAPSPELTDL
jgi:hypothetical protein